MGLDFFDWVTKPVRLRLVSRFEAPIQPFMLCCKALSYASTFCGFASRLKGFLGGVVLDRGAVIAALIAGFAIPLGSFRFFHFD